MIVCVPSPSEFSNATMEITQNPEPIQLDPVFYVDDKADSSRNPFPVSNVYLAECSFPFHRGDKTITL